MSEDLHAVEQNDTQQNEKPFVNKFIFPVLVVAALFYIFALLTNDSSHADSRGEGHATEAADDHMQSEGEHHDHGHDHDHDHDHHDHEH